MHIQSVPDTLTRLTQMGDVTLYEPAGDRPQAEGRAAPTRRERFQSHSLDECISYLTTPKGRKAVLKTMMTTACEKNCFYCPFRVVR